MHSKNVSYPKEKRILWYQSVDRSKRTIKETCAIFGISRKTYYKWRKRDFRGGGNTVSSSFKANTKLTWELCSFIERAKLKTNYGPLKMKLLVKRELGLDVSTTIIYRYYLKRKLIRKPQKRYPWYSVMKKALAIKNPGEGVQFDVKYVYTKRKRNYQFSVFDPFTKKYFFFIYPTKESINAMDVFKKAQKYFGFKISSVQTDNGSEFRGTFHNWLTKRDIAHYFIPKKSPWWNSNVERVHRTIDDEFYLNPLRSWETPEEWLRYYNFERIHLSINGLTPQEKLESVTLDC